MKHAVSVAAPVVVVPTESAARDSVVLSGGGMRIELTGAAASHAVIENTAKLGYFLLLNEVPAQLYRFAQSRAALERSQQSIFKRGEAAEFASAVDGGHQPVSAKFMLNVAP